MIRELRQVALDVARCSAAIEMPAEIAARDELIRRFVSTVTPRRSTRQPRFQFADIDELPEYGA